MKAIVSFTFAVVVATGATNASAENFIPDLTGTWNAVGGMVIRSDGSVSKYPDDYDINQFVVADQTGGVFKVTHTLKPKQPITGTHGGTPLEGQPYQMLGVINGTGPQVRLADIGDTTVFDCSLEDEGMMSCSFVEPGDNAIAGYMVLERGN